MSKMAEVYMDIVDLLYQGVRPSVIAQELNIPVTWVYPVMKEFETKVLLEKGNTEVFNPYNTVNS